MALLQKVLARFAGTPPSRSSAAPDAGGTAQSSSAQDMAGAERLIAEGNQLEDAGRLPEALARYREAARIAPQLAKAHLNLGIGLAAAGDPAAAVAAYRTGLSLDTAHPFLHYNLANALYLQGDFAGARGHAQQAIAAKPDLVQAHVLLANALEELGHDVEALAAIEHAIALDPAYAGAHVNRVRLLENLLRVDDSIAAAQEALRAFPEEADLHWGLAVSHLLRGDFAAGWREHEWRPAARTRNPFHPAGARWDGKEDLQGRSILLYAEYGFGDTLQFLRFVPQVAQRAARVVLAVQGAVAGLVRAAAPAHCLVVSEGEPLPATDLHFPLLSLPFALDIGEPRLASGTPYLQADAARVAHWRHRLEEHGRSRNVGIVWSGNPLHGNDRNRSMSLGVMAGLAASSGPGCRFVSLQPQVRDGDRDAMAQWPDLLPWGFELRDFADTAALVQALDLVITVDTSVAHLAGALGRPLWVLVPYVPDWRWQLQREDSPWYPTARVWRQSARRDWAEVVARVGDALRNGDRSAGA